MIDNEIKGNEMSVQDIVDEFIQAVIQGRITPDQRKHVITALNYSRSLDLVDLLLP